MANFRATQMGSPPSDAGSDSSSNVLSLDLRAGRARASGSASRLNVAESFSNMGQ